MISGFQLALLIGATLCAIYSRNIPRASLWILAGAASFIASTAWARYDMPYPPAFTFGMDAIVALSIYLLGKDEWEECLGTVFKAQVLVSIVYLMGPITIFSYEINFNHWVYVVILETLNWAALTIIWRKAKFEKAKKDENNVSNPWAFNIFGFGINLQAQRARPPFTKV